MAAAIALDPAPRRWSRERDYRIVPGTEVGAGGPREKARRNLDAVRTLKTVEAEGREATPEEQTRLARYVGWGALPQVFERFPGEWREEARELRGLVTAEEWEGLKASTPNAHYTAPVVIEAMWAAVRRLGVRGGARVLEPALGVGHFFGLQPAELDGPRTGVELETVSARMARLLYPQSAVRAGAYEAQPRLGGYDLVITNVPFGNYGVVDPRYGRHSVVTRAVHDYFIGRSLEEVRPGGVVAVVTSRYTLDKQNDAFRAWAGERASLLGAIRLPSGAFRQNAGTEVVADILFLQRPFEGSGLGEPWRGVSRHDGGSWSETVNTYFLDHPEQVLGRFDLGRGLYGRPELVVEGTLTPERLAVAVERLPAGVVPERGGPRRTVVGPERPRPGAPVVAPPSDGAERRPAPAGAKPGAFVVEDERLYVCDGAALRPAALAARKADRVRGMVRVRDAAVLLVRSQVDGSPDADIAAARAGLNRAYDVFLDRHGPLRSPANSTAFATDPDAPLLLSLEENYDRERNRADKAAIFTRRTVEPYVRPERAGAAAEALAISLAETGRVDWERISELLRKPAAEAVAELGDLVFEDPATGEWATREEYLSGPVRARLRQARAAAETDTAFARNVAALDTVQPRELGPAEIKPNLGASWIPPEDVLAFARHLFEDRDAGGIAVEYAAPLATWVVRSDYAARGAVANQRTWGTERAPALGLLEDALNQRVPTVTDFDPVTERNVPNLEETIAARDKQQAIRAEFERWIWSDPERAGRLCARYNDTFNGWRRRTYDGSHLQLPGINRAVLRDGDLARHQKDGVWRQLQQRTTLLALPVGAGKTYTMVAAAQEGRRIGLLRKSLFVVPTSLVEQWAAEFYRLYPTARVLVGAREHLAEGARQEFLARCATSDYDAVIVAHSSFGKLPVRPETQAALLRRELGRLEEALDEARSREQEEGRGRRSIVKDMEKAKKRLEARIAGLANERGKDRTLFFEDLGFDSVFVDEAHYYKNLALVTKMSRVAGLPSGESERAWDMYAKTRHVLGAGGRVVFATGTPVTNTLAEVYNMQRFLQEETLEELGIGHFDAWAATFAQTVTSVELAPGGSGYRSATRFAAFNNAPELAVLFSQVTELRGEAELQLHRPAVAGGAPRVVVVPGSEELREFVTSLGERAERIRRGGVDARLDNMLKVTGDGRRAALDLREVGLPAAAPESRKVVAVASRVHSIWEVTHDTRSAQAVFCDLSTPKGDAFSFYVALREELAARGVPEGEVRFIHEADGDSEKLELFQAVNAGRVRVVLGSTEKLGTGANFQERLIAAHHVDAPWRPADVEQRNGRILRPGNTHAEVQIYYYVTSGSFDAYMWQTLERKQRFIDQLLSGEVTERSIEDVGGAAALTAAEAKALASGNPEIMEVVKLDTEIRRLAVLQAHHENSRRTLAWDIRDAEAAIERGQARHAGVLADLATARSAWAMAGAEAGQRGIDAVPAGGRRAAAAGAQPNLGDIAADRGATDAAEQPGLADTPDVRGAAVAGGRSPGVAIVGVHYRGDGYRKEAAAALEAALRPLRRASLERRGERVEATIGSYLGFDLKAQVATGREDGFRVDLRLVGRESYDVRYTAGQPEGAIASLEAQAQPRHLEHVAATLVEEQARLQRRLEGLRQEAAKSFDDGPRLAQLRQARDAIVDRLHLRNGAQESVALTDELSSPSRAPDVEWIPGPAPHAGHLSEGRDVL